MLKLTVILLIGLINIPKITPCRNEWDQCGGNGYTGDTACCNSLICKRLDDYYYQCQQGPTTTPPNQGNCNGVYSQCGGQNWQQSTCCINSVCVVKDAYYSQCLPASDVTATTTAAPTTTKPTTTTPTTTTPTTTIPTTTTPTTTTPTTTQSTSSSTTTQAPNQNCVDKYQQCDGIGYTGSKTCCAGTVCNYINNWYSQCKPTGDTTSSTPSSTTQPTNDDSQRGITTRYWDCCKASCGWRGKAYVSNPVQSCELSNGVTPINVDSSSVCDGGDSAMCTNQQPWSINSTFSFGFAAAHIGGQGESDWCCACYLLTFTSTSIAGKKMIVQVTNTGGDLSNNHFDLQMPGGGVGIFNGCIRQFPNTPSSNWGEQYGGISSSDQCAGLPTDLQPGCYWRFDWFRNANNPDMVFKRVECPSELTDKTNCRRL